MSPSACNYYVDEAGDPVLFDGRGNVLVGRQGCSSFFILGLVDILEPEPLATDLNKLRERLLADPYFRKVPSMSPQQKKTALAFHAKDDLPEVRREVFSLLLRHNLRFFAVVRDKRDVLDYVRERNERESDYRYDPNELYDYMVRRLFQDLLHKNELCNIRFAKRGKADRTLALIAALEAAQQRFSAKWKAPVKATLQVCASEPVTCPALQAADYFLWALQRVYERREDRFLQFVWPAVSLVRDLDDKRHNRYGVYYTKRNPLTLAAINEKPGI